MNQTDVVFDGFSFNGVGCVITDIDYMTTAKSNNQLANIANTDGTVLVQSRKQEKYVTLSGYYVGQDYTDAQQMYDVLTAAVNRVKRPLLIPHAGGVRQFNASISTISIQEPDGMNRLTFTFEFVVPIGAAEETEVTMFNDTVTTPTKTFSVNILGSAKASVLITLRFTSVSGGAGKTVSILNGADMTGMTISRDWASGDTVILDTKNLQLYINGTLTAPTGRMIKMSQGYGSIIYSDTLTTRSVQVLGKYNRKDL